MSQFESFHRGNKISSESKFMPATIYNEMTLLFHGSGKQSLFIPIRSMQYMAVIDREEVIFVYTHNREVIEFSWRKFKPQIRNSLDEPVSYTFEYYDEKALETMVRAQGEFSKAVHQMHDREHEKKKYTNDGDSVISFTEKSDI